MAKHTLTEELRTAERRLHDRLLFTFGPTGSCYTKDEDLHLHRTRQQVLTKVSEKI
jgi:hypothetical protein